MKIMFFPRLAWTGIRTNRKLYLPYLLSCCGMVMMYYIMHALSISSLISEMAGGTSMGFILALGKFVIALFALIFLFYTNTFLLRRRYKEFGLYSVLGMDKRGISRVIFWETLIIGIGSILIGLVLGIIFSKYAELGLLRAIGKEVDYRFRISFSAVWMTFLIFGIIDLFLLLRSLWKVARSNPMELLRSENAGEKSPKANWVLAVLGVLLLGVAYYLAVTITSPLTAVVIFFIAVLMVIVATYLLFVSGSVALCRLLQKNKRYYYHPRHFVSVSSMVYRMKRNGAGLASICILSTMVLVMISSTSSLYFGTNDALASRFLRENYMEFLIPDMERFGDDTMELLNGTYSDVFAAQGVAPENVLSFRYTNIAGLQHGSEMEIDSEGYQYKAVSTDDLRQIFFISVDDYNRSMGTDLALTADEAMICTQNCSYPYDSYTTDGLALHIVGTLNALPAIGDIATVVAPSIYFVISDYALLRPLSTLTDKYDIPLLSMRFYYGYDLDADSKTVIDSFRAVRDAVVDLECFRAANGGFSYSSDCLELARDDFLVTYGGLFFLGIMLSIVFCFAAVLIIYYKQICEGYEDQARFEIMQKVGMTQRDIRRSINSQTLTVFFAPLLFAGLHLGFAFPLIWKLLQLFMLTNLKSVLLITVCTFAIFGVLYALVYKITAGAYYSIVSKRERS